MRDSEHLPTIVAHDHRVIDDVGIAQIWRGEIRIEFRMTGSVRSGISKMR
jgi:hypothetical protein